MLYLLIKIWLNIKLIKKFLKTINFFNQLVQEHKDKYIELNVKEQETLEQLRKLINFENRKRNKI